MRKLICISVVVLFSAYIPSDNAAQKKVFTTTSVTVKSPDSLVQKTNELKNCLKELDNNIK